MTKQKKELSGAAPAATAPPSQEDGSRGTWSSQFEFFLSCLGFAVGVGNVWRFPFLAYENGGAAFLIPYWIMLLCAGLPLFFLELAIGQYVSLGPNILFQNISPLFCGLGWAMVLITFIVCIYYNMLMGWSLFYSVASFSAQLPWATCNNTFNSVSCLSKIDVDFCNNQSLVHYNKTCLASSLVCSNFGHEVYNGSHCLDPNSTTGFQKAEFVTPRISSSEDYYRNRMLGIAGKDWDNLGHLRWELVGYLALAWIIVAGSLIKGVKSSGKVVYFTALFPYVVLVALLIRGATLPGAYKGIEFYILKPDLSKLADVKVWNAAATQIFYSLSAAFGGLITLSSYNKFDNNCMRDAIIVAFTNCLTSLFAGFAIFSILGFIAQELGVEIKDVVESGTALAFVAYPAAVARMPLPQLWSLLFFVMLITLGLDSQFTFVETVTTAVFDQFESARRRKSLVVLAICGLLFLLGLPLCLEGGALIFNLLDYYAAGISVLVVAITEIVAVVYIYGFRRLMKNIREEMKIKIAAPLYLYWAATWTFVTPVSLLVILVLSLYFFEPATYGEYEYPVKIRIVGWITTLASIAVIFGCMIYAAFKHRLDRARLLSPTSKFAPAHLRGRLLKEEAEGGNGLFQYVYDNDAFAHGGGHEMKTRESPSRGTSNRHISTIYPQI